jgi:hypothetical protein
MIPFLMMKLPKTPFFMMKPPMTPTKPFPMPQQHPFLTTPTAVEILLWI